MAGAIGVISVIADIFLFLLTADRCPLTAFLLSRNRLVQAEQNIADRHPSGKFGGVKVFRAWEFAGAKKVGGGFGVRLVVGKLLLEEFSDDRPLFVGRHSGDGEAEGVGDPRVEVGLAFGENTLSENAGRFDELRVVE